MQKILMLGAGGQIGTELIPALRKKYHKENVIAADIKPFTKEFRESGPWCYMNAMNADSIARVVMEHEIDTIYHMVSILSATGEKDPQFAWKVNMETLINVLEVARQCKLERVIWPSSIAAFGPTTPNVNTPDVTVLEPSTMYGITKVTGELLLNYYWNKYKVDGRSVRLPGIISSETPPGGGTTDYAVEIFYEAIKNKKYTCFLREDSMLPMMYMPDCSKGLMDIAEADGTRLSRRVYNMGAMSFTPKQLAEAIKKVIPEFTISYKPDFRQAIADSWPKSLDDSGARLEWNWKPDFNLATMTKDMIEKLSKRLK